MIQQIRYILAVMEHTINSHDNGANLLTIIFSLGSILLYNISLEQVDLIASIVAKLFACLSGLIAIITGLYNIYRNSKNDNDLSRKS